MTAAISKPVKLTERQSQVLDYIRSFRRENGYAPALREIMRHFGIGSTNGARDHLMALQRKGFITVDPKIARGIVIHAIPRGVADEELPTDDLSAENVRLRELLRRAHAALDQVTGPLGDACGVLAELADEVSVCGKEAR